MASLKNIKIKIQSVKKTSTVTRAMEAVSAVKMRKAQERALSGRAYAAAALSALERIASAQEALEHPLMQPQDGKTCLVVITSDKGLAGALNSSVIRRVEREIAERNLTPENTIMIAIGRRGGDYFAGRGWQVEEKRENIGDDVSEADMRAITNRILAWRHAGEVGSALVVYTNFLSTFEQEAVVRQIVPVSPALIRQIVEGIRPVRGAYARPETAELRPAPRSYRIEPDAETVLAELLPRLLNIAVFHALLESKASEHSARMVAMKSATDKAKEVAQQLTRVFNRARQAAITREISEIVGGMEAMR